MRRGSRLNMYACHAMPAHIQMLLHKLRPFTPPYEYAPRHRKHPMSMSYGEARFFEATRRFYTTLFDGLDPQYEYEYLALDQLVPPNNLERYTRYFDNIKTIVIDRDPRDLYLLNKLFWKEGWIPTDSTEVFIKWFELIRRHRETEQSDPRQVLHLRFEDCLLDYDATVARIETFLGIGAEHHVRPRTVFSPDRSAKNFRLWERYPGHDAEIATIERALGPYCYGTR